MTTYKTVSTEAKLTPTQKRVLSYVDGNWGFVNKTATDIALNIMPNAWTSATFSRYVDAVIVLAERGLISECDSQYHALEAHCRNCEAN